MSICIPLIMYSVIKSIKLPKLLIAFLMFYLTVMFLSCKSSALIVPGEDVPVFYDFLENESLKKSFSGFVLYDPSKAEELININGSKLFIPASNTKLFTFFTAKSILKDSLPALKYYITGDSLIFMGTGNPWLMNNDLPKDNTILNFLIERKEKLFFSDSNFNDYHFGDGWAWSDYMHSYQLEKSPMPVFGNSMYIWFEGDSILVDPEMFRNKITFRKDSLLKSRKIDSNEFQIGVFDKNAVLKIPFKTDSETITEVLGSITGKKISVYDGNVNELKNAKVLMQQTNDSIYIRLLHRSDNFIAEQLLLMCSFILFDTMNTRKVIELAINEYMPYLKDSCRWVDGSGLSRYNLFSPNSIVQVLEQIRNESGMEQIQIYFPEIFRKRIGQDSRKTGAVYAKTGTLSNNFNLSGYIITNQSNIYVFCLMANHFLGSNRPVREEYYRILSFIIENY